MADVTIAVKATDAASGVFERVAKNLRAMQQESRRAGEGALERALGSGQGAAGALADYLGVGLQAIVVDQIGNAFKNATAKALEMRDALREGKASAGDLVTEMAKGVPILGGFVSGWSNLRELITNEKAKIAEINRETELNIKLSETRLAIAKQQTAEHQRALDIQRGIRNEARLIWMQEPDLTREKIRQRKEEEIIAEKRRAAAAIANVEAKSGYGAATKAVVDFRTSNGDRLNKLAELDRRGLLQRKDGQGEYGEYQRLLRQEEDLGRKAKGISDAAAKAKQKIAEDSARVIFDIEQRSLSERAKHEVGVLKSRAEGFLKGYADLVTKASEDARTAAAQDAEWQRQREEDRAAEKAGRARALSAGYPSSGFNAAALSGAYQRDTLTPNLVTGQGSGAAARQREEALARDEKMQKQLDRLASIDDKLGRYLEKNARPAGPVLAGAF
jgi:hypothetical protein